MSKLKKILDDFGHAVVNYGQAENAIVTLPAIASQEIKSLMLETLRDTITEADDVAEIGEIFAKKVEDL